MTAKLYWITIDTAYRMDETGSRYSLTPWDRDTIYSHGDDDGGADWELPAGYEVAESKGGSLEVFDAQGRCCELRGTHGHPVIITAEGGTIALTETEAH